jgi:hypothetical protein
VIDLVLQGYGEKALRFHPNILLFFIEADDLHAGGSFDLHGKLDDAQASLFPNYLPLGVANLRIYQLDEIFSRIFVIDIQNDDALKHAHLRRRQPHSRRVVHGLHHVLDQANGIPRDRLHRRGKIFQLRIGIGEDL